MQEMLAAFMDHAGIVAVALLAERAPTVTAPALLIDGGASPPWAAAAVEALAGILPHAERRTLPGQTHDVAAQVLAPALEAFFGAHVRV